ncbi:MAG TPA: hypothetical protein VM841_14790 [Actinomycetota bacterium]|nr:hypothetical protein [Actinomycetota bacterium]
MTPKFVVAFRTRAVRAASVAIIAVLGAMLWAPTALAISATESIEMIQENQGWYWSSNREFRQCVGTDDTGLCYVNDLSGAAPVEPGHLAVALQMGGSDMRSYLIFPLFSVPEDATVSAMTLTLPVSRTDAADQEHTTHHTGPGAKAPSTTNEARASITACAVTVPWGAVEGAPSYAMDTKDPRQTEPVEPFVKDGVDCAKWSVKGKAGEKAWTFDLTKIAQMWVSGALDNNGVVLLPDLTGGTDSWRIEFHGAPVEVQNNDTRQTYVSPKEAGSTTISYTAPDATPEPTPEPTGDGGGFIPPPPATFEPAPEPAPTSTDDPQPVQPADPEPVGETATPTAWYAWLALPLGAVAHAGLARAVGREAGEAGANRVATMLRRRRLERAGE